MNTMRALLFSCFVCTLGFLIVYRPCYGEVIDCKKTSHLAPVRLKNDLLCDYEKTIRPLVNYSKAINVTIRMVLKFFTYDMHSNTLSIHNWLALNWKDEHLKWDPAKYDSIKQTYLPSEDIWMPDLSVYNRNDLSGSLKAITPVDCLITSTGVVVCVPPGRHDAVCMPNLIKYPYDIQNCSLRFGSWIHTGEELNPKITQDPVTLDDYLPNAEWKLISITVHRYRGHFPDVTYPRLIYSFVIQRHSATQAATVVIPALVMIIITLITLWMDPQKFERLCLACCNVISHYLYLEFLAFQLPSSGDNPPLLILFARDSLLLCTFSLCLTIIVKPMANASKQSPALISQIVNRLLTNRLGQLLLHDSSLKDIKAKGQEDAGNMINNQISTTSKEWSSFGRLLDRLSFVGFAITYFAMLITFIA